MKNQPHSEMNIDAIPQPLMHEPGELVMNVHRLPGTSAVPDLESQDTMGLFLLERHEGEDAGSRSRIIMQSTGYSLPGIQRTPVGHRNVTRWRKTDPREWLISPRVAAAVMIGSAALFNGVGNADTVEGAGQFAAHSVYRYFDPVDTRTVTGSLQVPIPGEVISIGVDVRPTSVSGSSEVDPAGVESFVSQVVYEIQRGGSLRSVEVIGNASDEWGGNDTSIGVPSPASTENDRLAAARAAAAAEALPGAGLNVPEAVIVTNHRELVRTQEQKAEVLSEAQAAGLATISAAIEAVDSGQPLPPSLEEKVVELFTGEQNRGVSLSAVIERPGAEQFITVRTVHTITERDEVPNVPEPGWFGFIPMVPVRRRERYDDVKPVHRLKVVPSKEIMRPAIIRSDKESAWVRVRPEAVQEDGSLVPNAWAYTRKYEHLLRDGRIADMIRADREGDDGKLKSLRIMFVDKSPAQETVDAFSDLLTTFMSMEDGKLADRISAIFVYPSENAGVEHGDPKRIAIGGDKQADASVLGTYTYILDMVELHMPTTWEPEDLRAMFESFTGPAWTLAHEVGGHGTDESDQVLRLRRVLARGIPNAHVVSGDPRAQKMRPLRRVLRKLTGSSGGARMRRVPEFDITYAVNDATGKSVTVGARVGPEDPRLAHAATSTIVGFRATAYAGTNDSEHYAETAAASITGIPIPYDEASVSVPELKTDTGESAAFATGYHPDKSAQRLFARSVGAEEDVLPTSFAQVPSVKISHMHSANDPMLRAELIRARNLRTLTPEQMVAILARVARREKKPGSLTTGESYDA